jgi:hypothetical protein
MKSRIRQSKARRDVMYVRKIQGVSAIDLISNALSLTVREKKNIWVLHETHP